MLHSLENQAIVDDTRRFDAHRIQLIRERTVNFKNEWYIQSLSVRNFWWQHFDVFSEYLINHKFVVR